MEMGREKERSRNISGQRRASKLFALNTRMIVFDRSIE
jgi:hypothetical protein